MINKILLCFVYIVCSLNTVAQDSWCRQFEGTIGSTPISLVLHKWGHTYRGTYWYHSQHNPVSFTGDDTTQKGRLVLNAFIGTAEEPERFTLQLRGDSLWGQWRPANRKAVRSVGLRVVQDHLPFTFITNSGTTRLRSRLKNSPVATYTGAAVWPVDTGALAAVVKSAVRRCINTKNIKADVETLLKNEQKTFFDSYRNDNEAASDSEILAMSGTYNYDLDTRVDLFYTSTKIICITGFGYAYTGGAHGNYGTVYEVVDRIRQKRLRLADVLTAEGRKALPGLLATAFRKQYGLKPNAPLSEGGLFENRIKPTDNFFLTEKLIGFTFQPYEIGPYVMGQIDVTLSLAAINQYLQPAYRAVPGSKAGAGKTSVIKKQPQTCKVLNS